MALRPIELPEPLGNRVLVKRCNSWYGVNDKVMIVPRHHAAAALASTHAVLLQIEAGSDDVLLQQVAFVTVNAETLLKNVLNVYGVPVRRKRNIASVLPFTDGRCVSSDSQNSSKAWCLVRDCKDCHPPRPWFDKAPSVCLDFPACIGNRTLGDQDGAKSTAQSQTGLLPSERQNDAACDGYLDISGCKLFPRPCLYRGCTATVSPGVTVADARAISLAAQTRMYHDFARTSQIVGLVACFCIGVMLDGKGPGSGDVSRNRAAGLFGTFEHGPSFGVALLKLFVLLVLISSLGALSAPQDNFMAVPEALALLRKVPKPPQSGPFPTYEVLLGLAAGAPLEESLLASLRAARQLLVFSWAAFLAIPVTWPVTSTLSYVLGAVPISLFISLSIGAAGCHTDQATLFLTVAATLAVPSLHDSSSVSMWLGQYLVQCVLAPTYLSAGLAKVRYMGALSTNRFGSCVVAWPPILVCGAGTGERRDTLDHGSTDCHAAHGDGHVGC